MLHADIWEKAYKLKVFQIWELTEEVYKDWEGIFSKKVVKDRVASFVASQLKANALIKVNNEPPIFTFPEFVNEWKKYLRFNICPVCGRSFLPKTPQQVYCSEECREKADYEKKKDKKKQYLKQRKDLTRKASRKYKQKLQAMTPSKKRGKWEKEELEILKQEYRRKGKLTRQDLVRIAQKLGRSFSSVMHKYYEEVRK